MERLPYTPLDLLISHTYTHTHTNIYIDIYIYILCHTESTDLPHPLSPPVSIVHRSQEIFKVISCIGTELLYIGSSWSMWKGLQEYIACEFVLTSLAVSRMSGSTNFDKKLEGNYTRMLRAIMNKSWRQHPIKQ